MLLINWFSLPQTSSRTAFKFLPVMWLNYSSYLIVSNESLEVSRFSVQYYIWDVGYRTSGLVTGTFANGKSSLIMIPTRRGNTRTSSMKHKLNQGKSDRSLLEISSYQLCWAFHLFTASDSNSISRQAERRNTESFCKPIKFGSLKCIETRWGINSIDSGSIDGRVVYPTVFSSARWFLLILFPHILLSHFGGPAPVEAHSKILYRGMNVHNTIRFEFYVSCGDLKADGIVRERSSSRSENQISSRTTECLWAKQNWGDNSWKDLIFLW